MLFQLRPISQRGGRCLRIRFARRCGTSPDLTRLIRLPRKLVISPSALRWKARALRVVAQLNAMMVCRARSADTPPCSSSSGLPFRAFQRVDAARKGLAYPVSQCRGRSAAARAAFSWFGASLTQSRLACLRASVQRNFASIPLADLPQCACPNCWPCSGVVAALRVTGERLRQ